MLGGLHLMLYVPSHVRSAGTAALVRDMWAHAELGRFVGALPASAVSLPAHGVMALQLRVTT